MALTKAQKEYRIRNKEKIKKYMKQYRQLKSEKLHKQMLDYYYGHKDEISKRRKKYYKDNDAHLIEYSKKHYKEHVEEKAKYNKRYVEEHKEEKKKYNEKNKEKNIKYRKQYKQKNKDRCHEDWMKRQRGIEIIEHVNKELLIFSHQGRCAYCQKDLTNDRTTHIDHLIPVSRYAKLGKKCPHKYSTVVPACHTCNESKGSKTPLEFMWANIKER